MTKRVTPQQSIYIDGAMKAGLSAKAAAVYVALLEAGEPISPKSIIIRTGLHRQYAYDAIRELQERALISSIGKDRSVRYLPFSPAKLMQDEEKRRIDIQNGVQTLLQLYGRSTPLKGEEATHHEIGLARPNDAGSDDRLAAIERSLLDMSETLRSLTRSEEGRTV